MKLATWNVNSLKVRLPQVIEWLKINQPDILCLQETKLSDDNFPRQEIAAIGYHSVFAGQKTYNGVAIISKQKGDEISIGVPDFLDEQKRVIAATYGDVRIISVYVPNGETVESEKYLYKLRWLPALNRWVEIELKNYAKVALLGDFNIAPEDRDVYDPETWRGKVLCTLPERNAFQNLLSLGFADSFRLFDQPDKSYTWWDYRMMAFRLNRGLRIDHILLSDVLARTCVACGVDKAMRKQERPSDHAPLMVELFI